MPTRVAWVGQRAANSSTKVLANSKTGSDAIHAVPCVVSTGGACRMGPGAGLVCATPIARKRGSAGFSSLAVLPAQIQDALAALTAAVAENPDAQESLHSRWRAASRWRGVPDAEGAELSEDLARLLDLLDRELPALTRTQVGSRSSRSSSASPRERCCSRGAAAATRRDVRLARLLALAASRPGFEDRVAAVARARVVEGPLLDALACAPLLGDGRSLALPENAEAPRGSRS